ncbi:hypothetical protein [Roseibium suaedae]|uniref:Uncharacterized protein n=1 Tax=Roseibium suaedae TaxID=735517 RepID=A0A1M7IC07_9HYPH|nr:hypothetical protein [Roseibium suaedae]SHM37977.1 hypothetical protein SAMN05444272_2487 [Roseibium suaedae]
MTDLPGKLEENLVRLRRLSSEIRRLARNLDTPAARLNLLLLKHDLQDLLREMRAGKAEVSSTQSRAHSASRVAGAYAVQAQRIKTKTP